ncbi:MAG: CheR family methyltransferase [Halanaerobiales bacterium]
MQISEREFKLFKKLIYDRYGIYLAPHKHQMIQARLGKVLRKTDLKDFNQLYQALLDDNKQVWLYFADEVTTHKTDFFRENSHFRFLADNIGKMALNNSSINENQEIRVWSAGCSTGEEPYTIAMVLNEYLPSDIKIKILATDISSEVIAVAQRGIYKEQDEQIDQLFLDKYFKRHNNRMHLIQEIKDLVTFRTFNLMHPFPFQNKFDIIFCRNVMIYFDNPVQVKLIRKFYDVLVPGGLFFIGHSESLSQKQYRFKYIQPTVYQK